MLLSGNKQARRSGSAAWVASVGIHVAVIFGLSLVSVAIDLGDALPEPVTEAVSVSFLSSVAVEIPDPEALLAPEPLAEVNVQWPEQDFASLEEAAAQAEIPVVKNIADDTTPARAETSPAPLAKPESGEALAFGFSADFAALRLPPAPGGGASGSGDGIGIGGAAGASGSTGIGTGAGGSGAGEGAGGPAVGWVSGSGNGRGLGVGGSGSRPPRPKRMERGPYPNDARRSGAEGSVTLLVEVLADGKVGQVEVARSSGHTTLDRAAWEAAQHWKFIPAERDGRAVAARAQVQYNFRLVDQ